MVVSQKRVSRINETFPHSTEERLFTFSPWNRGGLLGERGDGWEKGESKRARQPRKNGNKNPLHLSLSGPGNRGSGSGSGSELEIHDPWSRSPLAALDTSEHGRQDEGVSGDKVRTSDPTFVARERRQDECGGGMDSSYTDNNGLGGAALKESSPLERRNSLELDEGSTAVSDHWQDFNAADGQVGFFSNAARELFGCPGSY